MESCWNLTRIFFYEALTRVGNSSNWVNYTYTTECRMCCSYGFAVLSFMMCRNFFECGKFSLVRFSSSSVHFMICLALKQPIITWEFSLDFDIWCCSVLSRKPFDLWVTTLSVVVHYWFIIQISDIKSNNNDVNLTSKLNHISWCFLIFMCSKLNLFNQFESRWSKTELWTTHHTKEVLKRFEKAVIILHTLTIIIINVNFSHCKMHLKFLAVKTSTEINNRTTCLTKHIKKSFQWKSSAATAKSLLVNIPSK